MRRKLMAAGMAVVLALPAAAAIAQTDTYPGSTTSTTTGPTEERISEGVVIEGEVFINEACLFLFPSSVTVEFNGQFVETDNVESDTCARQRVTVTQVGPTTGADAQTADAGRLLAVAGLSQVAQQRQANVSISIDGRSFAGRIEGNTIVVSGTGLNGQPRRVITTFNVADKSARDGLPRGAPNPATPGSGPLARTGAAVVTWIGAGLLLVLIGMGFQRTASRRRRYSTR